MKVSKPGDVIDEEGSNSRTVIGTRYGSKVLLACGVPDLEFDVFVGDC